MIVTCAGRGARLVAAFAALGVAAGCVVDRRPAPAPPEPTPVATIAPAPAPPPSVPTASPVPTSTPTPVPEPVAAPVPDAPPATPEKRTPGPAAAASGTVSGRVEIVAADGSVSPAVEAVVWIPGVEGPREARKAPRSVAQQDKRFAPHVVAVGKGEDVSFPNLDKIYHNVFSRTPGTEFDLGFYRSGASKSVTFERPGLVRVYCNIHPKMAAYVMVLDRAVYAVTDEKGAFTLTGVPAGRRTVTAWHERAEEQKEAAVTVGSGRAASVLVRLDVAKKVEPPHKKKDGQDYPKGRENERY